MNKTGVEYANYSWNPVTGCFHSCGYCYARRIAERFGLAYAPQLGDAGMDGACKYDSDEGMDTMLELKKPYKKAGKINPYPMAFAPTFHRYRLNEPKHTKKPGRVFVVDMGDLFGEWVPDEWIQQVFEACERAPWHKYLFLTKNPGRFQSLRAHPRPNMWYGFTVNTQEQLDAIAMSARYLPLNAFISIEPLHGAIDLKRIHPEGVEALLDFTNGGQYYFMDGDRNGRALRWVIIGAETGNRKDKIIPKREWIERILEDCRAAGVPVFMKNNLAAVWGEELIQEYPEGLL